MRLTQISFHAVIAIGLVLVSLDSVQAQTTAPRSLLAREASQVTDAPTPAKKPVAETVSVKSEIQSDKQENGKTYTLRYKLRANEKIVSEVTHLATTNTKINDVSQSSQSRTVSSKVWEVKSVDKSGNMTFTQSVASVDLSQQVADGSEIRYNSATDKEAPPAFKSVAETIGKPLATITITTWGEVTDRSEKANGGNLGMGDITIPMPQEAITLGQQWETDREIRVRRTDGSPKIVKVRELYTLEKVSAGVAVISIRSEPLTPLREPEIEAQAIQQMSNGEVRFDIDAGRLISKSLAWDKTVVGFSGAGSMMEYSARLDEKVQ
ncbi:MAG: hypothetical protein NTW52_19840 [Planctomycetota bacterium]|nr:hypothetical protein [Planctomycetota bacterium]